MTYRLPFVLIAIMAASGATAQASESAPKSAEITTSEVGSEEAENTPELIQSDPNASLEDFLWVNRPLVIFADTDRDPRFAQQMDLINALPQELLERDVVVLTDTDPAAQSALRETLRPRGFTMVLLSKDGTVYLRKPQPWTVREISASIDKLPLRQQEIRDRREP
ncbi:DUF4174 domain-containing protein [Shimia sp. NS0008-38b]|uniref:DUF4174 domain-containing protein n=1 Tax=Shimia sp. NS0008-38b TaxID=3127653 RepID=UPI00310BC094